MLQWTNRLGRSGASIAATALVLGSLTAAGPAAAAVVSPTPANVCDPDSAHVDAKARPGAAGKHDPNAISASELAAREADFTRRTKEMQAAGAPAALLAAVNIPVVVHVIQENSTRAGGNIPDSMINSQINVLNDAFDGGTIGGAATQFGFVLQSINRVTNTAWYPIIYGSTTERQMKNSLRQGGDGTLNIYLGDLSDDLLGWATFPASNINSQGRRRRPERVAPRRHRLAVQPRRHRDPRGRPLARALPHIPGWLRRPGRPGLRHPRRGLAGVRLPERAQHLLEPRQRPDHELHGLHRRLVHVRVHRRPGHPHGRAVGRISRVSNECFVAVPLNRAGPPPARSGAQAPAGGGCGG